MRILIVDDSEQPLRELESILGSMGHEIVGMARNGQDGVSLYRRLQPDVVVMDLIMPRMTGLEALQSIRQQDPAARVVMVCSLNSCSAALEAERQGASYFITKPFEKLRLRIIFDKLACEVAAAPKHSKPAPGASAAAQDSTPRRLFRPTLLKSH